MTKVLIAEDDRYFLNLMQVKFEHKGYHVLLASDGESALNIFLSEKPALVILDGMMPKMDGFSLCKAIRQTNIKKYVVVVIVSGVFDKLEYRFDAKKVGADDFIKKPFDLDEFLAYMEKLLKDAEEKTKIIAGTTEVSKPEPKPEVKPQKYSVEKKVIVYYPDGQVLKGTTLALNPGGKGFNMTEWDTNKRTFIVYESAIKVELVDEF